MQDSDDVSDSGGLTSGVLPQVDVGGSLISPVIDLTSFAYANLSFWTWWETECINIATGADRMIVMVSSDYPDYRDGYWTTIGILNPEKDPDVSERLPKLPYSSGGFNAPGAWVKHVYNLTPYAGYRIKIRFRFSSISGPYNSSILFQYN